jgi:endo-1,4-beta-xylanase
VDIQSRFEQAAYILERNRAPIIKKCNVYLPFGYDKNKRYPVIYVLHGLTGNEFSWLGGGEFNPVMMLDHLIASGKIQPCIVVFPNGNSSSAFSDNRFENQAGYYFFADELLNDLIPFIESEYSVRTDRDSRAICGFSMGGMQTINIGLCRCLQAFSRFGAIASAPTTYNSDRIADLLERENKAGSLPIHVFYNIYGSSDRIAGWSHQAALAGLRERSHSFNRKNLIEQVIPGGHDYSFALIGLYNFLLLCDFK